MENCVSCTEPTKKYRCSICSKFSCSLTCYKQHKNDSNCTENVPITEPCADIQDNDGDTESTQRLQMFTTDDTVDPAKLRELEKSDRLKQLLYNPHLRQFLTELDRTPDAWKAMKVAMLEPLFVEFANECLNVVEPDEEPPSAPSLSASEEVVSSLCSAIIEQLDE